MADHLPGDGRKPLRCPVHGDTDCDPCDMTPDLPGDERDVEMVCGVWVTDDREVPCVLPQGHDGFCDFGPEYDGTGCVVDSEPDLPGDTGLDLDAIATVVERGFPLPNPAASLLLAEVRRLRVECGLLTQRIEAAKAIESRPTVVDADDGDWLTDVSAIGYNAALHRVHCVLSSGGGWAEEEPQGPPITAGLYDGPVTVIQPSLSGRCTCGPHVSACKLECECRRAPDCPAHNAKPSSGGE